MENRLPSSFYDLHSEFFHQSRKYRSRTPRSGGATTSSPPPRSSFTPPPQLLQVKDEAGVVAFLSSSPSSRPIAEKNESRLFVQDASQMPTASQLSDAKFSVSQTR